eukprot:153149_1
MLDSTIPEPLTPDVKPLTPASTAKFQLSALPPLPNLPATHFPDRVGHFLPPGRPVPETMFQQPMPMLRYQRLQPALMPPPRLDSRFRFLRQQMPPIHRMFDFVRSTESDLGLLNFRSPESIARLRNVQPSVSMQRSAPGLPPGLSHRSSLPEPLPLPRLQTSRHRDHTVSQLPASQLQFPVRQRPFNILAESRTRQQHQSVRIQAQQRSAGQYQVPICTNPSSARQIPSSRWIPPVNGDRSRKIIVPVCNQPDILRQQAARTFSPVCNQPAPSMKFPDSMPTSLLMKSPYTDHPSVHDIQTNSVRAHLDLLQSKTLNPIWIRSSDLSSPNSQNFVQSIKSVMFRPKGVSANGQPVMNHAKHPATISMSVQPHIAPLTTLSHSSPSPELMVFVGKTAQSASSSHLASTNATTDGRSQDASVQHSLTSVCNQQPLSEKQSSPRNPVKSTKSSVSLSLADSSGADSMPVQPRDIQTLSSYSMSPSPNMGTKDESSRSQKHRQDGASQNSQDEISHSCDVASQCSQDGASQNSQNENSNSSDGASQCGQDEASQCSRDATSNHSQEPSQPSQHSGNEIEHSQCESPLIQGRTVFRGKLYSPVAKSILKCSVCDMEVFTMIELVDHFVDHHGRRPVRWTLQKLGPSDDSEEQKLQSVEFVQLQNELSLENIVPPPIPDWEFGRQSPCLKCVHPPSIDMSSVSSPTENGFIRPKRNSLKRRPPNLTVVRPPKKKPRIQKRSCEIDDFDSLNDLDRHSLEPVSLRELSEPLFTNDVQIRPLRFILVGNASEYSNFALKNSEKIKIVSVVDPDQSVRDHLTRTHSLEHSQVHADWHEVLNLRANSTASNTDTMPSGTNSTTSNTDTLSSCTNSKSSNRDYNIMSSFTNSNSSNKDTMSPCQNSKSSNTNVIWPAVNYPPSGTNIMSSAMNHQAYNSTSSGTNSTLPTTNSLPPGTNAECSADAVVFTSVSPLRAGAAECAAKCGYHIIICSPEVLSLEESIHLAQVCARECVLLFLPNQSRHDPLREPIARILRSERQELVCSDRYEPASTHELGGTNETNVSIGKFVHIDMKVADACDQNNSKSLAAELETLLYWIESSLQSVPNPASCSPDPTHIPTKQVIRSQCPPYSSTLCPSSNSMDTSSDLACVNLPCADLPCANIFSSPIRDSSYDPPNFSSSTVSESSLEILGPEPESSKSTLSCNSIGKPSFSQDCIEITDNLVDFSTFSKSSSTSSNSNMKFARASNIHAQFMYPVRAVSSFGNAFVPGNQPDPTETVGNGGIGPDRCDHQTIHLQFEGGATASLVFSAFVSPGRSVNIYGSHGSIRHEASPKRHEASSIRHEVSSTRHEASLKRHEASSIQYVANDGTRRIIHCPSSDDKCSISHQIDAFIDALCSRSVHKLLATPYAVLRSQALAEYAEKSRVNGHLVRV